MVTQEELNEIFQKEGKENDYETVGAEFMAFKEFKVRWQRSYRWAEFKVSDYFQDAPAEVVESLARTLFSRIAGKDDIPYTAEMCQWITSDRFVEEKQPIFLKRSRNITRNPTGKHKDLDASYDRLIGMGLVKKDPRIFINWMKNSENRKVGNVSVLMKVISMNPALDDPQCSDQLLDYCLFHELNHIEAGFDAEGKGKTLEIISRDTAYPDSADLEKWITKLGLMT